MVLSRPEWDPSAPVDGKRVEEVFVRVGRILHLHVGGQVIRTTPEHPFYVQGKGWVEGGALQVGDLLSSHNGQWLPVEDLLDTGTYETVHNFRVADWHTYFVGGQEWGFSVWAHNAACANLNANNAKSKFGLYEIKVKGKLYKIGKADLNRVTQSSGLPTRLHQQLRKLEKAHGKGNVTGQVVKKLGTTTTKKAKIAETARIQAYYDKIGIIPKGNKKSFKPKS